MTATIQVKIVAAFAKTVPCAVAHVNEAVVP